MRFNKYTLQHKVTLSDLQIFPNFNLKRAAITAIMQFYELPSIGRYKRGSDVVFPLYRAQIIRTVQVNQMQTIFVSQRRVAQKKKKSERYKWTCFERV